MKVNFLLENYGRLKHIGCSTAAMYLMKGLREQGVDVSLNSMKYGFDIVHAHTFGPYVLMMLPTGRVRLISAHSTPSLNKGNLIGGIGLWNCLYKNIYNLFDYVLPVSKYSERELRRIGITAKMKIVPNCVNRNRFRFSSQKRKKFREQNKIGDELLVVNVAQLTPRKGLFKFMEIARKMKDVKFIWVGGLPYSFATSDYAKVQKAIANPPKNMKFLGFVDDITEAYCGADIFMTTTRAESFGMTVLEAESCGIPCVATDLPVFREVFGSSVVYAKGREGFERGIEKLMSEKQRRIYSRRGIETANKYTAQKVTKDLKKFYESII